MILALGVSLSQFASELRHVEDNLYTVYFITIGVLTVTSQA